MRKGTALPGVREGGLSIEAAASTARRHDCIPVRRHQVSNELEWSRLTFGARARSISIGIGICSRVVTNRGPSIPLHSRGASSIRTKVISEQAPDHSGCDDIDGGLGAGPNGIEDVGGVGVRADRAGEVDSDSAERRLAGKDADNRDDRSGSNSRCLADHDHPDTILSHAKVDPRVGCSRDGVGCFALLGHQVPLDRPVLCGHLTMRSNPWVRLAARSETPPSCGAPPLTAGIRRLPRVHGRPWRMRSD
jgi:hypothetical protein